MVYFGGMTVEDRVVHVIEDVIAVVETEDAMTTRHHEVVQGSDGRTVIRFSGLMQAIIGGLVLAVVVSLAGSLFSIGPMETRLAMAEEVNEEQRVEAEKQEERVRDVEEGIRRIDGNMARLHQDVGEIKRLLQARAR